MGRRKRLPHNNADVPGEVFHLFHTAGVVPTVGAVVAVGED